MPVDFKTERHERLFEEVLGQLQRLGYQDRFLARSYRFSDWFLPDTPPRVAPAAAFWTTPPSYDNASFAVLVANGTSDRRLVSEYRALGAPLAFEVREDRVVWWIVGRDEASAYKKLEIEPDQLGHVFDGHKDAWSRPGIIRIKNLGLERTLRPQEQADLLVDTGLIPALEGEIRRKLSVQLVDVLSEARKSYARHVRRKPDTHELFRLVFRFLAAKVLHDREEGPFSSFTASDAQSILQEIERRYGDVTHRHAIADVPTQKLVCRELWTKVDFKNLSVETLAYIYENTLVDDIARKKRGIHSTPHSVARFMVHQLPFDRVPDSHHLIVDPFTGHGIFLVAALQRLKEQLAVANLLPPERHAYFTRRLRGFDNDAFAVEVAKLCLMLADFPNGNGWQVTEEDTFVSPKIPFALKRAGVVLCNPPFEDFTREERSHYSGSLSVHKPIAFLESALRILPRSAMLGIVLPRQFVDGGAYRPIREAIIARFDEIDVVALPDRIFHKSKIETALLIAKSPRVTGDRVSVAYAQVADRDRQAFLSEYKLTSRATDLRSSEEAAKSLAVVLPELWRRLDRLPRLVEIAKVQRGLEWHKPIERHVSRTDEPGFKLGIHKVSGQLYAFQCPPTAYLSTRPEDRRRGDLDAAWGDPKVIANAARLSRGAWKVAAFVDERGLVCSQRFHAIWPTGDTWGPHAIAAVINGPIANAFVAAREGARDVTVETMRAIPLPRLSDIELAELTKLVRHYTSGLASLAPGPLFSRASDSSTLVQTLLEIDAIVLKGYRLPPRLERQLLDMFQSAKRQTPFAFPPYFPPTFQPYIPLWMYLSPEYQASTAQHLLSIAPKLTDPELLAALDEAQ